MNRYKPLIRSAIHHARRHTGPYTVSTMVNVQVSRSFAVKASTEEATGVFGNKHRSDAEEIVSRVRVIEVDGTVALCDGGGGNLGHPIEYIKLDYRTPQIPVTCKYCGLRYIMKQSH